MPKTRAITDIYGNEYKVDCIGCAVEQGKIQTLTVLKTKYFEAHQDIEIPIPGFIILASRRHVNHITEFIPAEREDYINALYFLRDGMWTALHIKNVHFYQEEGTNDHFHTWLFPRHSWMDKFGKKIQSIRPIMEHARSKAREETLYQVDETEEAAQKLQTYIMVSQPATAE